MTENQIDNYLNNFNFKNIMTENQIDIYLDKIGFIFLCSSAYLLLIILIYNNLHYFDTKYNQFKNFLFYSKINKLYISYKINKIYIFYNIYNMYNQFKNYLFWNKNNEKINEKLSRYDE